MNCNVYLKLCGVAFLAIAGMAVRPAMAQSVIFPQEQQPGSALLTSDTDGYTLKNDLFTARFIKRNGSLFFDGCPELGLEAGTELFELKTGDGSTTVKASEMTLGAIRELTLTGDPKAVKGSKRFDGCAIEADFTSGALSLTWRAVLRDGSHYLRTELEITSASDVKMYSITPMIYSVNTLSNSAPKVVGNTRGAVLQSDKIFAGLETPMGINTAGENDGLEDFTYGAWTSTSFSWAPGKDLPNGILALGYDSTNVVAARGYLSFKEAGAQTVTFRYASGSHRLNIVGVDICSLDGTVQAFDYHFGYTGSSQQNNSYSLNVPATGIYLVRYFVETRTETITSSGTVNYSGKVVEPVLVYDLAPGSTPQYVAPAATETPVTRTLSGTAIGENESLTDSWTASSWFPVTSVPLRINELGYYSPYVYSIEQPLNITSKGTFSVEFLYASGSNRLNLCGVDLVDANGDVVAFDYHDGYTGSAKSANVYSFFVPFSGYYTLRYFAQKKSEAITSTGNINVKLVLPDTLHLAAAAVTPIRGLWSRNTTLLAGETWKVSSVVGLIAPGQARRSFLAYSERERAVPWRAMPAYISWYELNINRNNSEDYSGNMTIAQCVDVVKQWKTNLYDKYKVGINSFVWDDGWDNYGTWTFNPNFPNGFQPTDSLARLMGAGQGAWLGPVGGYGTSGTYRRNYWKNNGGMQLSNPAYYKVFTDAIVDLCNGRGYDFRFFKFDGISAQFSSVGPDAGTTGEENAEAIIRAERMVREDIKEDIFFNTTVGTWASPFWFRFTDAVWRQENDYGEIGNQGTDREKWITYRDRLVYQNFVQNSPLCPINTLMTHGFILSQYGSVSKNMDYDGIVRELRCAFACGSGMVELYNDYALTNSINNGALWGDIAECIRWQQANADVLPDAHWVGGNPWDGLRANVYGWASWNGKKATLALRNPAAYQTVYGTTLREALEIPAYVSGTITLKKAFANQAALSGLDEGTPIDIDTQLNLTLPASSVYVFDGIDNNAPYVGVTAVTLDTAAVEIQATKQYVVVPTVAPADATDKSIVWTSSNEDVATVAGGVITGVAVGTAKIIATTVNGLSDTVSVTVVPLVIPPYAINFDKDASALRTDRYLNSVSLTAAGGTTQTFATDGSKRPYQDLTANAFEVEAGQVVTPTMDWTGTWMHSYVYIDLDASEQFDVSSAASDELVSFNYYAGKDKTGATASENPGVANLPAFTAPAVPGTYYMRFKVDWNSIDPAGQIAASNHILTNGGSITDVLLKVVAPVTGLSSAAVDAATPTTYDLQGRPVSTPARGVYVRNGRKVLVE